jgi:hypothetical protein
VRLQEYDDVRQLKSLVQRHLKFTGSQVARQILLNWDKERVKFVKVGLNMLLLCTTWWARFCCCCCCGPEMLLQAWSRSAFATVRQYLEVFP